MQQITKSPSDLVGRIPTV